MFNVSWTLRSKKSFFCLLSMCKHYQTLLFCLHWTSTAHFNSIHFNKTLLISPKRNDMLQQQSLFKLPLRVIADSYCCGQEGGLSCSRSDEDSFIEEDTQGCQTCFSFYEVPFFARDFFLNKYKRDVSGKAPSFSWMQLKKKMKELHLKPQTFSLFDLYETQLSPGNYRHK